jgi:hypothetical protein
LSGWKPNLPGCPTSTLADQKAIFVRLVHNIISESVLHAEKEAIIAQKVWGRNYYVDLSTEGADYTGDVSTI